MRQLAAVWVLFLLTWLSGCGQDVPSARLRGDPASPFAAEIEAAIGGGAAFLISRQDADGAWRSDGYGAFKHGDALTPLALRALVAVPRGSGPAPVDVDLAVERGADYLAALAPGRDASARPLQFVVYTASLAVEALSAAGRRHRGARAAWLAELEGRQLTEDLGWGESEKPYGGWGYSSAVPRKPPPGSLQPPLLESNVAATAFALQALRVAGSRPDGPACRRALVFLERMQNYADPPSEFDDGGFVFIYDDPVRNKAGVAGTDDSGETRFTSYGSATADGLRGLLLCGLAPEHPRVRAALDWLGQHFAAGRHPGAFAPRLEGDRDGLYFYWVASVAQTLRLAGIGPRLEPAGRPAVSWAEDLARELLARQRQDGSWSNPIVTMREDEPLVASSMAVVALASLRREIP